MAHHGDEGTEYVWRFAISGSGERRALCEDPTIEFIREQLCNLLDVVGLYKGDMRVHVDRFCLLNDEARTYLIYEDEADARVVG